MLTHQLDKQRRQKTFIGSIQSKWRNASLSLEELSFKSMAIALSTILLLGTLGTLLFINMQHPQTNNGRTLQADVAPDDGMHDVVVLQALGQLLDGISDAEFMRYWDLYKYWIKEVKNSGNLKARELKPYQKQVGILLRDSALRRGLAM